MTHNEYQNQMDYDATLKKQENPLCCERGGKWSECKNPCSKKYIGDVKSEMWGVTDEYSIHKYHWNLCDECYKIEQEEGCCEDNYGETGCEDGCSGGCCISCCGMGEKRDWWGASDGIITIKLFLFFYFI